MELKEHVTVLIIEDDEDDYFIARSLLTRTTGIDCDLEWARDYDEGLSILTKNGFDVCLVDYRLGARDGLQLLREANEMGVETPLILLTGQGDYEVDLKAMMAGAADYLVKGQIDAQLLERSIRYARERKRAEERNRELAQLLDKARDAICAYDLQQRVIYWNKSAERLTGYSVEEILEMQHDRILYAEDGERVGNAWEVVLSDGEWTGDLHQIAKNGEEVVVESRWTLVRDNAGNPRSVLAINTDVTERKRLESHFLRAQRMESIGTLVGGIAHDLGNLLVPILLGVKVLSSRHADSEKTMRTLEMIRRSAQRGSDMVKQVLAFARGVEGERVLLHLDDVIQEVVKIASETFPATIEVETDVSDDLPMILGDFTQLQQVIMNLCVNARDAMPDGGVLKICASAADLDDQVRAAPDAKPGTYVCVHVIDTGAGISQDILDKVFEPFFTTKPSGKGTGLGLSSVYSIVKSHGGFVDVESEEGVGTSFHIFIPIADRAEKNAEQDLPGTFERGDGETILLVDDEELILDSAAEILEATGFSVLTAADGREAIELFGREVCDIDVVITDLMMPEVDGFETIREIRKLDADVPIIAASGMAIDRAQDALDAGAARFIAKPFTAEKLVSAIGDVLSHGESIRSTVRS